MQPCPRSRPGASEVIVRAVQRWDQWLLVEPDQRPVVQLKKINCLRCKHGAAFHERVVRAGERACATRFGLAGLLKLNPLQPQSAADAAERCASHRGLEERPEFAFRFVLQEMWVGYREISKQATGRPDWTALPPAVLFENPDAQTGRRDDMDLMDPAVRSLFEENMVVLPGPDVANVWFLGE